MKHIFIINPSAGKGKGTDSIENDVRKCCEQEGIDYEIYITKAFRDGQNYVAQKVKSGEKMRFYACGGDGTLYEVVNGAYGYDNAEVAVIPYGSGNDFIRIFGKKEDLIDVKAQINGTPMKIDVIKCGDYIAVNQCSMGLDAEICAKQAYFKKIPWLNGEAAYTASLLYCFLRKMKSVFTIKIDDEEPFTVPVLFCLGANSRWYGGGYKGAPLAIMDDGLLDMIIVRKTMNRLKLLSLISTYKKGEHLSWDITDFRRIKKVSIHSDELAAVNVDGECEYVHDSTFELIEKGITFVVPANSTYFEDRKSGKISGDNIPEKTKFYMKK